MGPILILPLGKFILLRNSDLFSVSNCVASRGFMKNYKRERTATVVTWNRVLV